MNKINKTKIVIVGGGAGGLELAAKLSQKLARNKTIEITLVDKNLKHVWKPLLHEIAAGTFANYDDEIDYISYSYQMGFTFILGEINAIDRIHKSISIAPYEGSKPILPERQLPYDILILAVGSKINNFNIPGVIEHCLLLDDVREAERCNQVLLNYIIVSTQSTIKPIQIGIVGGGATGVELAAELNHVLTLTIKYGHRVDKNTFQVTIIEEATRLLSNLPERIAHRVSFDLKMNNINILTNTKIISIEKNGLITAEKKFIAADMIIWAAGVKGNTDSIKHDLEVNKINQFMVTQTLQTTKDKSIFAFGDCASCPQVNEEGKVHFVPPRAQAAHQQAGLLVKAISCYLRDKELPKYNYRDYGSLIILSHYNVVGNLMNKVAKSLYVEGVFARFAYWFLYKKHLLAIKGIKYIILDIISECFMKKQKPEIKLH